MSEVSDRYVCRLQNVNGGHSGTLAFYFCPFWGACRQVTRACRQDYFLWSIFNYTEVITVRHVELQRTHLLERQSESALRMADTVNSYTHYNVCNSLNRVGICLDICTTSGSHPLLCLNQIKLGLFLRF